MLTLSNNQIKEISIGIPINIATKKYYGKIALEDGIEIIISKLAKLVQINCPKYLLARNYDEDAKEFTYYYLSEDIGADILFLTASELGINSSSLYDIWIFLERYYPQNKERLLFEIVKIYLFDIFTMNYDRKSSNYGFLIDKDGDIKDVYIFDNEESFDLDNPVALSSKLEYSDKLKNSVLTDEDLFSSTADNLKELEYFLQTSSSEYIDLFLEMYEALTPSALESIFQKCEEEGTVLIDKEDYLEVYEENYKAIGRLIEKRGLKRWKKNT